MDVNQLFATLGVPLTFGAVAGVVVGYTAKKLTKLLALALGAVFILVQLLAYKGLITINWGAVQTTAEGAWTNPHGVTLAEQTWDVVTANLPFAGAFGTGFFVGFKLG